MTEPELLLAHRDFVRAVAAEIVRDVASLDDVEQQTLLAAWRHGDARSPSWKGFLATLARNFARQFHRGEKRRRRREELAAPRERTPSVADVVAREEQRRAVVVAVLALDEPERGAVLLRFYEGVPPREIARRLSIPVETARTRVKRGVERVRARLLAREEGESQRLLAWLVPLAAPIATTAPLVPVAKLAAAGIVVATLSWTAVREGGWLRRGHGGNRPDAAMAVAQSDATAIAAHDAAAAATRASEPATALRDADPDASAPKRRLRGRVVDARGAPVADARVFAWPTVINEPVALDDLAATKSSSGPVRSGTDGRFELTVLAALDRCTLFATKAGLSPGTVLSVEPGSEPTVVLEDDDFLVGTVTDERGEPIEGALLHGWGMHGGARLDVETKSGADGAYRLPYPTADRAAWQGDGESFSWWVEVTAAGFAPIVIPRSRDLDDERPPAEARCDVVLWRGATLTGSVVDAESRDPIGGARVVFVAFENWESWSRTVGGSIPNPRGQRVVSETVSDEAGRFVLEHLPALDPDMLEGTVSRPQILQIDVFASGYAPAISGMDLVADGGCEEKQVELWRPARVVGRVVDPGGRPLNHVRVAAREVISGDQRRAGRRERMRAQIPPCVGSGIEERVVTDAQGHYEIDGLPATTESESSYHVALDDYDWTTQHDAADMWPGVKVGVRAGAVVTAPDLVGVPQRSLVLDVVDQSGAPISGALVHREPRSFDERTTDAAGRVRWIEHANYVHSGKGFLETPGSIRLRVARRGFATLITDLFAPSETDSKPIRVVMTRGHTLRGTVVDPLQRPAPHAPVIAWSRAPTPEEKRLLQSGNGDPSLRPFDTATDGNGNFVFEDLPDETVYVEISPPLAWKGRRPGAAASFRDVPVDGAPVTLRLADE